MTYSRIGVVTGANKGIGLAVVRQLALQYPSSSLYNGGPLLIYLTSRDKTRGKAAVEQLRHDAQLKPAKALAIHGGVSTIEFHALDITDEQSRSSFADHLRQAHSDGIDFVINNAGIALDGFDANVVKTTLNCNYYSTLAACHIFLPLLKSTGRLVNVASMSGALNKYISTIRDRFASSRTEEDVTSIMRDFQAAVEAGREKDVGFPSAAYAVSKAGLIGATRALAAAAKESDSEVLINCCCPGYVNTDMSKGNGTKTPDSGAQTPVMLALRDISGQSGLFWQDGKVREW